MIEIQCTSCYTRYRLDARVLPDDTPTFKCSRCGHVFSVDPREPAREPLRRAEPSIIAVPAEEKQPAAQEFRPQPPTKEPKPTRAPEKVRAPESGSSPRSTATTVESRLLLSAEEHQAPAAPAVQVSGQGAFERSPGKAIDNPPSSGHNLTFDFRDEPPSPEQESSASAGGSGQAEWQVGEEAAAEFAAPEAREFSAAPAPAQQEFQREAAEPDALTASARNAIEQLRTAAQEIPEEVAYLAARQGIHSAGFFLAVFFVIILAFGALSFIISNTPAASTGFLNHLPAASAHFASSVPPAAEVTLSSVTASYEPLKGDLPALIISGTVRNRGAAPLHVVKIEASLLDAARHGVAGESVALGNTLSDAMIGQMTPHELAFYQKLEAPAGYVLAPGKSAPFKVVFVAPPKSVRTFRLSVSRAAPAASAAPGDS